MTRAQAPTGTVVSASGLSKTFRDVVALADVTFSIQAGETFGILGPNGAGKTTTVECVAGALRPDGGRIEVLGVDPAKDRATVRGRVGYQLQSTALPPALRVGEALRLFAAFYPTPADVPELLRTVGLEKHRKRPFGSLSGGQKQRLSIALALIGNPDVVVFDELTTGLDPQGRRDVRQLVQQVKDSGITVVLVTHYLDDVERLCDRLAIIDAGRTRFVGTPAELLAVTGAGADGAGALEDAYLAFIEQPAAE
ncbi:MULTISPECIES: ABC transporter ATP-binding protein [unclassified Arthrobacter]|uniref:ABC transporter ATP-binding protein n=1 Tax=unclassified Arthrobacter TaxID=235627 RepID=UPI001E4C6442|nr:MULTISPECIES: ABC transporter ATP-binding protein [unclassified Arthrobacter]MCC9145083.1 ABC transporter ATP-binding protein [Arthrobacter sp. zg-Y919]MDK1276311.1 ABC transporter ATP-binding protein [Arthrobacter sp. zg.Y919]MDM7988951.1 ABC transporter ATP-binding protein [Arthrobacter sp. zg-Y877]WIB02085.1 ABC transporter ATP-binding protein [Arthrobacter sp. zg-Y919]